MTDIACTSAVHRHPPLRRECQGCRRRICGPDDAIVTTTGRYFVCTDCYPTLRAGWSRGGRA